MGLSRIRGAAFVLMLTAGLAALACGRPSTTVRPTVRPTPTPTAPLSGIASGAAVRPNATGLARPAPPPSDVPSLGDRVDSITGSCPAAFPIKVTQSKLAYEPGDAGYAAAQATDCYTTLAAATAAGARPADASSGEPPTPSTTTPAPPPGP